MLVGFALKNLRPLLPQRKQQRHPAQAAATKRAPHARTSKNDIIINEWSGISINGHE